MGASTVVGVCLEFVFYNAFSLIFFFFSSRRRHTRFDCDWSSDVCSSDLRCAQALRNNDANRRLQNRASLLITFRSWHKSNAIGECPDSQPFEETNAERKIGRASCRERV